MSKAKNTQQHPKVEIAIKNFGPIAEANIDLRPLTVCVGPSNTGKTYFATLVYALHGAFNDLSGSSFLSRFKFRKAMDILSELLSSPVPPSAELGKILKNLGIIESGSEAKNFQLTRPNAAIKIIWHRLWQSQLSVEFFFQSLSNLFNLSRFQGAIRRECDGKRFDSIGIGRNHQSLIVGFDCLDELFNLSKSNPLPYRCNRFPHR